MIKKILKAVLPATYRKIDKSEKKILAALIKHNNCLLAEIAKLNGRIDSLENTLNNMRPLFAELRQTVENEANWKRDDLSRIIEENKNLLQLLDFSQENMFYAMYKKDGESETDAKKRFFKSLPEATGGLRLLQKGNLKFLKEMIKICEANNLTYWIQDGTLLGAVRHNGFIPWDDDIDTGMLRSDIGKLANVLKDNPDYKLNVCYDWWSKCRQIRFMSRQPDIPCFVDVFIFDECDNSLDENWIDFLERRKELMNYFESDTSPEIKYWKGHPFLSSENENSQYIQSVFDRFSKLYFENFKSSPNLNKSIFYNLENFSYYHLKRLHDASEFFPLSKIRFEGVEVNVPKDYETLVSSEYGDIYKLPKDMFTHVHFSSTEKCSQNVQRIKNFIGRE